MSNLIQIRRYEEGPQQKITSSVIEERLQLIRNRAAKRQVQETSPAPSAKRAKKQDHHLDDGQPSNPDASNKRRNRKQPPISSTDTKMPAQQAVKKENDQILHQLAENNDGTRSIHQNEEHDTNHDDPLSSQDQDTSPVDQPQQSDYIILGKKTSNNTTQSTPLSPNFPQWIAKPNYINSHDKIKIDQVSYLQKFILKKLKKQGMSHLFPVQSTIIPTILKDYQHFGLCTPLPVHDICVSAPTGSGKTLVYVLPIIQVLMRRSVMLLRALILVPTADLAYQVKKVFEQFNEGSGLKIATAIGQRNFKIEQGELIDALGGRSNVDILIATPGRLIDHINMTKHFTLEHLRFLVLDEADKLLISSHHQLIMSALKACYKAEQSQIIPPNKFILHTTPRDPPIPSIVSKYCNNKLPLQKLLFSATLTYDPEKLAPLELFSPLLYQISDQKSNLSTNEIDYYVTPAELTEYYIICEPGEKPLTIIHFMQALKHLRVLCFTNSKESTKRLSLLLSIFGDIRVATLSSEVPRKDRKRIIKQFSSGEIDLLICSDTVARGIDIEKAKFFKTMLGKKRADVKKFKVNCTQFNDYIDKYQQSLEKLEATITEANNNKKRSLGPFRKDTAEKDKDT
ncbi:uncharacterized protein TRIADDRAFT_52102 [Trichoplax adhaerens]|uniref:RNA helicase n=1 Tax=Trichoplax adhaerens TaxID=10228 RepID=B3RLS3_TRIAD|nr:hypothetical protein TRIADDRAFT_52102 [Trichoplax adhaerens]EDV29576.1 hypothetical protein TRIADDRAFT_52102 [Trichoplax adhaerens]|eukprot:XP_002108778.1 hypothetical protein TRIADDRAFT_52102 [Trichoplax adhaerens]